MFRNRTDAGQRLADRLVGMAIKDAVILALPRGGVPVAAIVASALHAPLGLMLVRKIGAPGQPELALGAIAGADGQEIVVNEELAASLGLTTADVQRLAEPERAELQRRGKAYLGGRPPVPVAGKTVILIDDGIATGATARAALQVVRKMAPAAIILAVPVASPGSLQELRGFADQIVCLETPAHFQAVGAHYASFPQVRDDEVLGLLKDTAA